MNNCLHRLSIFSAALLLSILFTACPNKHDDAGDVKPAKGGKQYGGSYTMNILRGSPNGLDPVLINSKHADDIATQIYDRLIDLDTALQLVPELAKTLPTISPDGKTYHFDLRTDALFHDDPCFPNSKGRALTARDVKYSFERCCDPRTRSVAYWAFQNKVVGATEYFESINANKPLAEVTGFKVLNDSTFEIQLIDPYAPFIFYLCNSLGDVHCKEAVDKYGADFFRHPVGTGPFSFVSWKPDQELVLKRNPKYWQKDAQGNQLPFLNELHFQFIKSDNSQFSNFREGTFDECFGIPTEMYASVIDVKSGKATPEYAKYTVLSAPAMLTWFFDFNTTKAPFNNVDVRRAFNYAIDREKIVRFILQGAPFAPAIHGIVPPVFSTYDVNSIKGYTLNIDTAKALLAKAGYPDAKGLPEVTLHIYPEPRLKQVAEAIQAMLTQNLNVHIKIQELDFPQLMTQSEGNKLQFWGTRWYGDYPDAETYLNLVYGDLVPKSDSLPSYPNSTRYNNPKFNDTFKKAVSLTDNAARTKLYQEAEQIAIDEAPIIPLFYERHYKLLQSYVRDNPLDAMARYEQLKYVWFDKK